MNRSISYLGIMFAIFVGIFMAALSGGQITLPTSTPTILTSSTTLFVAPSFSASLSPEESVATTTPSSVIPIPKKKVVTSHLPTPTSPLPSTPIPSTPLPSAPPASSDLCDGLIQDNLPHPMSPLSKPILGQTVTDPEFKTTIRRITNVGSGGVLKPAYSAMPVFNADESKLMLWHRSKGHELYDGKTYQFIRTLPLESPTDIEHVLWDPVDPDVLYYPSNYNAKPRLMRYRVSTNMNELIRDFGDAPTDCPVNWADLLGLGGDPQYMSWGIDGKKLLGLQCGSKKFVYDIASDHVLGMKTTAERVTFIVAPSGKSAYFEGGVYDLNFNLLRTLKMASVAEHANVGYAAAGYDTYNAVAFDDSTDEIGTLVTHNMVTAQKKVIIGPATGFSYPPSGTHISAVSHKNPGWVGVSVVGNSNGQDTLSQEILVAQPETGKFCRVAHHRSWAGDGQWGYWAEPHINISPKGTRLIFGSDWGNGDSVDTYVIELPSYGR